MGLLDMILVIQGVLLCGLVLWIFVFSHGGENRRSS